MRNRLQPAVFWFLFVFVIASLAGCYTQLGSVRSEQDSGYDRDRTERSDTAYQSYDDSTVYAGNDEYYDNDYWQYRSRLGFLYYYPSIYVGAAFYDPWYWDPWYPRYGWNSYYDPFWCGTAYPWLYAGWNYPRYWDNYPWYYGSTGRYRDYGGGRHGATRTFGNTRGGGSMRAVGSTRSGEGTYQVPNRGADLPTSYRPGASSGRGGATTATPPRVSTGQRGGAEGGLRGGSRPASTGRAGSTRSGTKDVRRLEPRAPAHPSSQPARPREVPRVERRAPEPSRQPQPPRESGGSSRGGGERSSGGQSYSPPPSHGSSAPPSGGGAPSNTGARGGNRR